MTTTIAIPDAAQLLSDPEGTREAESIVDSLLADAEEEEFAQLWAADPGNQGA